MVKSDVFQPESGRNKHPVKIFSVSRNKFEAVQGTGFYGMYTILVISAREATRVVAIFKFNSKKLNFQEIQQIQSISSWIPPLEVDEVEFR